MSFQVNLWRFIFHLHGLVAVKCFKSKFTWSFVLKGKNSSSWDAATLLGTICGKQLRYWEMCKPNGPCWCTRKSSLYLELFGSCTKLKLLKTGKRTSRSCYQWVFAMNSIIYNSSAVSYLQHYVHMFHDIKHFNMKPHWTERNTVWTPHWSIRYKNDFLADTQPLHLMRLLQMAQLLTRHIHSQMQRVEFPALVLLDQTRRQSPHRIHSLQKNATLIRGCVDVRRVISLASCIMRKGLQ